MLFIVKINIIKYLYKRDIAVNMEYISQRTILEKKYKIIDFFPSIYQMNNHYLITRYKQQNNIIYYLKIYLTYYYTPSKSKFNSKKNQSYKEYNIFQRTLQ